MTHPVEEHRELLETCASYDVEKYPAAKHARTILRNYEKWRRKQEEEGERKEERETAGKWDWEAEE